MFMMFMYNVYTKEKSLVFVFYKIIPKIEQIKHYRPLF